MYKKQKMLGKKILVAMLAIVIIALASLTSYVGTVYAASDIFLMPSEKEPCGLSQIVASRYGAVPIVRETGGLKDTIKDFGCLGGGNGYTFTNAVVSDLEYSIRRAVDDFKNTEEWEEKVKKIMALDFSWNKTAKEYIEVYNEF